MFGLIDLVRAVILLLSYMLRFVIFFLYSIWRSVLRQLNACVRERARASYRTYYGNYFIV